MTLEPDLLRALTQSLQSVEARPTPGSVVLCLVLVAALPLAVVVPMSLVGLAVAARLPPAVAAAVILAGATAGSGLAWVLARSVLGARAEDWLKRRGGWLEEVRQGALRAPLKWAVLSRFIPAPFVAAPLVLSSAGVGLGTTLLGTFLGMLPWAAIYVYAAHAGRHGSPAGFATVAAALVLGSLALRWAFPARGRGPAPARPRGFEVDGRPSRPDHAGGRGASGEGPRAGGRGGRRPPHGGRRR